MTGSRSVTVSFASPEIWKVLLHSPLLVADPGGEEYIAEQLRNLVNQQAELKLAIIYH